MTTTKRTADDFKHKRIAKIQTTFLGIDDHGIFTWMLHVTYGGSGQGVGGFALDGKPPSIGAPRPGTAFGCESILRLIRACGVREWNELTGKNIYVLFEGEEWNANPIGIANLPTEAGEVLLWKDITVTP